MFFFVCNAEQKVIVLDPHPNEMRNHHKLLLCRLWSMAFSAADTADQFFRATFDRANGGTMGNNRTLICAY